MGLKLLEQTKTPKWEIHKSGELGKEMTITEKRKRKTYLFVASTIARYEKNRNPIKLLDVLIKINLPPSFMVQVQSILGGRHVFRCGDRDVSGIHVGHNTTIGYRF